MSHSNPKVLFTFQFGSRIVPVLREQDLRKFTGLHRLLASQSLLPSPLLLPGSLCALSLAALAAEGLLGSTGLFCPLASMDVAEWPFKKKKRKTKKGVILPPAETC